MADPLPSPMASVGRTEFNAAIIATIAAVLTAIASAPTQAQEVEGDTQMGWERCYGVSLAVRTTAGPAKARLAPVHPPWITRKTPGSWCPRERASRSRLPMATAPLSRRRPTVVHKGPRISEFSSSRTPRPATRRQGWYRRSSFQVLAVGAMVKAGITENGCRQPRVTCLATFLNRAQVYIPLASL